MTFTGLRNMNSVSNTKSWVALVLFEKFTKSISNYDP